MTHIDKRIPVIKAAVVFLAGECYCKENYLPVIDRNHSLNYHTKCIKEFSQDPCEAGEEYSWNYETNKPECQDIEIVYTEYLESPCQGNLSKDIDKVRR